MLPFLTKHRHPLHFRGQPLLLLLILFCFFIGKNKICSWRMKDFNIVQITTHLTYFVVHASVRINLDNNGVFVNLYIYNYEITCFCVKHQTEPIITTAIDWNVKKHSLMSPISYFSDLFSIVTPSKQSIESCTFPTDLVFL
jgi:hypothetical protein